MGQRGSGDRKRRSDAVLFPRNELNISDTITEYGGLRPQLADAMYLANVCLARGPSPVAE